MNGAGAAFPDSTARREREPVVRDAARYAGLAGRFAADGGRLDGPLLAVVLLLLGFSLVMVFSATVVEGFGGEGSGRALKHALFIVLGLAAMLAVARVPPTAWRRLSKPLMLLGIGALALVLLPGFGHEVNGSTRWLDLGGLRAQPSELMKFAMVVYMADYLVRRHEQLANFRLGVVNVALVVGPVGALLLLEPDLGAAVLIVATVAAMMYVSGVRYVHMLSCALVAALAFAVLAAASPERMERLTSFQDPWADAWNSGFQLSQALIAFGRGEWFGLGLGQSIQKMFYLPHAANDFLAAVVAEELGFIGIAALLGLYLAFVVRGFGIAARASRAGCEFCARLAHGVVVLVALQAIINLGVNMGVLPTTGLTLPLMSYGGSSMVVTCALVGLVFAVARRTAPRGARRPA